MIDTVQEAIVRAIESMDIRGYIDRLVRESLAKYGLPHIEHGVLETNGKGWVRVNFDMRFNAPPAVFITTDYREGTYTKPKYEAPPFIIEKIKAAMIDIADIPVLGDMSSAVPSTKMPSFRVDLPTPLPFSENWGWWEWRMYIYNEMSDWLKYTIPWIADVVAVGIWGWQKLAGIFFNTALSALRNIIDRVLPNLDTTLATLGGWISNGAVNLNSSLASIRTSISRTKQAFEVQADEINKALEKQGANTEKQLKGVADYSRGIVEDIHKKAIDAVYEISGLMPGMDMSAIKPRNRTKEGFEFFSPAKCKINWVAIGL